MLQKNKMLNINRLAVVILAVFMMLTVNAQEKRERLSSERFRADLEQYITRKAGLTPKEAARFFPVYTEMMDKQRVVFNKIKQLKRVKPVTEAECKKNILQRDKYEIEIKNIRKTYHEKFMRILSAKKVYDVLKAEDKFHRQAFKRAAENMKNKDKHK